MSNDLRERLDYDVTLDEIRSAVLRFTAEIHTEESKESPNQELIDEMNETKLRLVGIGKKIGLISHEQLEQVRIDARKCISHFANRLET